MPFKKYQVIRDSREQAGQGWSFAPSAQCQGTTIDKLITGDYTIVGFEETLVIERKGSIAEFAGNLYQPRFEAELARLSEYPHPFVVLEFTIEDIFNFPASSNIPRSRWKYLRVTPASFLKRICEFQQRFPRVHFIFAGTRGKAFAASQFKRLLEADSHREKAA